jgi:hypothetical protein
MKLLPVKGYFNNLQFNHAIPNLKEQIKLHLNKTNNSLLITYVQSGLSLPLDVMASKYNTKFKNQTKTNFISENKIYFAFFT